MIIFLIFLAQESRVNKEKYPFLLSLKLAPARQLSAG